MGNSITSGTPFVVGWEEWLALPDLGLPAIRAKIDTGAKTSALHGFAIEPYRSGGAGMVRFGVHPIPGREDIARYCSAPIVDRREITSSNGKREVRYVIRTRLVLGGQDWGEIETTLANRENMAYRMLLGREAIRRGMLVDPRASFVQPRLSHKLYLKLPSQERSPRHLRVALITSRPERRSNQLLRSEVQRRGHVLELIGLDELNLDLTGVRPRVMRGAHQAGPFDVVVTRVSGGRRALVAAISAALESEGAIALNNAAALDRLRNQHLVAMALAKSGLRAPGTVDGSDRPAAMVVNGRVVSTRGALSQAARRAAGKAARALGLDVAAISFADDAALAAIELNPSLTSFDKPARVVAAIVSAIERLAGAPQDRPDADED